jgi:hypothetical protein
MRHSFFATLIALAAAITGTVRATAPEPELVTPNRRVLICRHGRMSYVPEHRHYPASDGDGWWCYYRGVKTRHNQ